MRKIALVDGTIVQVMDNSSPNQIMFHVESFENLQSIIQHFTSGNTSTIKYIDDNGNITGTWDNLVYDKVEILSNADGTFEASFFQHTKTELDILKDRLSESSDYVDAAKIMLGEV
jgi:hypothetical protein